MKNAEFLTKILTSDCRYFIVAKENHTNEYSRMVRKDDSILLIQIPFDFNVNNKLEELKYVELQKLNDSYIDMTIFLNAGYFPFQNGLRFSDFYDGFSISTSNEESWSFGFKPFLIEILSLNSNNLYEFKELAKKHNLLVK